MLCAPARSRSAARSGEIDPSVVLRRGSARRGAASSVTESPASGPTATLEARTGVTAMRWGRPDARNALSRHAGRGDGLHKIARASKRPYRVTRSESGEPGELAGAGQGIQLRKGCVSCRDLPRFAEWRRRCIEDFEGSIYESLTLHHSKHQRAPVGSCGPAGVVVYQAVRATHPTTTLVWSRSKWLIPVQGVRPLSVRKAVASKLRVSPGASSAIPISVWPTKLPRSSKAW